MSTNNENVSLHAFGGLAEDLLDLFLSPKQTFPSNVAYPKTPAIEAVFLGPVSSLEMPRKGMLRLDELAGESSAEDYERRMADWGTVYQWEVLKGFADAAPLSAKGSAFEGLRRLSMVWGTYLAQIMGRMLTTWELYGILGDVMIPLFKQLPPKQVGEAIRESITPAYLKAHASVEYSLALLQQDRRGLGEAEAVLQASDLELTRAINDMMAGTSSVEIGNLLKSLAIQWFSLWQELAPNQDFRNTIAKAIPEAFRGPAWYMGYAFRLHLRDDPAKAERLLKAIGSHGELAAAMEQYRWQHDWGGDRNIAVDLAWKSVARKYYHMSGGIPVLSESAAKLWDDRDQERLIGVGGGLETYCRTTPAINALAGGVSGTLGAYLSKAGKNTEASYARSQRTAGNKALTEAVPAADLAVTADGEAQESTDDEILSSFQLRGVLPLDPAADQAATREKVRTWLQTLTTREQAACGLKGTGFSEKEIAGRMGIGQQRVSQLLGQARRKWDKVGP